MAMQYSLQPSHTVDHRSNLLNDLSVGVSLPSYRKTRQLCRAFSLTVGYLGFYLTASILEERVATTPYQHSNRTIPSHAVYFRFPVVLNAFQSFFNSVVAGLYVSLAQSGETHRVPKAWPTIATVLPLVLIAVVNNLGSTFGNASLRYIDYSAFLVAKSCMLLPVVAMNVLLLHKRYSAARYLLFLAITAGIAFFTFDGSGGHKAIRQTECSAARKLYGLALLSSNMILEASTYLILEYVVSAPERFGRLRGPGRMLMQNSIGVIVALSLLCSAHLLPVELLSGVANEKRQELSAALGFIWNHPSVLCDVSGFALSSAMSQLLLFVAFTGFSSVLHTNIRIVRKTLSMLMSIIWFGKTLSARQWLGVVLVFGGAGVEGFVQMAGQTTKKIQ